MGHNQTTKRLSVGGIALGGGAAGNPFLTTDELKKLGFWIFLDVAPEVAYQRILHGGLPPFLQKEEDPEQAFLQLCRERTTRFRELADLIYPIHGERPPEAEAEILTQKLRGEIRI